jgi:tRNA G18 (ribose-2'-O)-methylase SpoU
LGAENAIRWEHSWNILEVAEQLKSEGFLILCLEGGNRSINLFQNIGKILSGQPVALFIGNEINGIDPVVLEKADFSVFLPMQGEKESLNVATAFGIAAYLLRYGKNNK